MSQIIDLDLLAGEPKTVTLGSREYTLPGDVPIPTVLKLQALGQQSADAADGDDTDLERQAATVLYEEILALFRVHQPDLESIPLGAAQLYGFIGAVYGGGVPDEPEAGPTRAKGSTRSTRKAPKSRSGSTTRS